jgi:hypothetical protein
VPPAASIASRVSLRIFCGRVSVSSSISCSGGPGYPACSIDSAPLALRGAANDGDDLAALAGLSGGGVADVPVAVFLRTSTRDLQDPTLSLPRQLDNCRKVLPAGFTIVAFFYDVESSRKDLDQRGRGNAHEA